MKTRNFEEFFKNKDILKAEPGSYLPSDWITLINNDIKIKIITENFNNGKLLHKFNKISDKEYIIVIDVDRLQRSDVKSAVKMVSEYLKKDLSFII